MRYQNECRLLEYWVEISKDDSRAIERLSKLQKKSVLSYGSQEGNGGYLGVGKYDVGIGFSISILSRQVFCVSNPDNEYAKCPSIWKQRQH